MDTTDEIKESILHDRMMEVDPEYRDKYINGMVRERMSLQGDCYPWSWEAIQEAIAQTDSPDTTDIAKSMANSDQNSDDAIWAISLIRKEVYLYWYKMALYLIRKELGL